MGDHQTRMSEALDVWGLLLQFTMPLRLFPQPRPGPDLCPGEKASTLEKDHERHVGCRPAPDVNCDLTMQSYINVAMVKTYQNMGFMIYHQSHRNRYNGYIKLPSA